MTPLIEQLPNYHRGITPVAILLVVSLLLASIYACNRNKLDNAGAAMYGLYAIIVAAAGSLVLGGEKSPDVALKIMCWVVGICAIFQFVMCVVHLCYGKPVLSSLSYAASTLSFSTVGAMGYYAWDGDTATGNLSFSIVLLGLGMAACCIAAIVTVGFGIKMLVDRHTIRKYRNQATPTTPRRESTATPGATGQVIVDPGRKPPISDRVPAAPPQAGS
jgi:hypothetical protein